MKIAGIGRDPKSDVSVRHDDYLAEISPHGNSYVLAEGNQA